jgi:hypothetical protein
VHDISRRRDEEDVHVEERVLAPAQEEAVVCGIDAGVRCAAQTADSRVEEAETRCAAIAGELLFTEAL